MRYEFTVIFKDGEPEVVNYAGENGPVMKIPDGVWRVGGNEDSFGKGINVTHIRPDGQFVTEAQHYQSIANYLPVTPVPLVQDVNLPGPSDVLGNPVGLVKIAGHIHPDDGAVEGCPGCFP
jgi:hypothetical protein